MLESLKVKKNHQKVDQKDSEKKEKNKNEKKIN